MDNSVRTENLTEEKRVSSGAAGDGKPVFARRNGFFKEQRAITSRRLPLAALSILMYFLYDIFGTVMAIQRERAVNDMTSIELAVETFPMRGAQIVSSWMGMRGGVGLVIPIVGAILLGIQGFAYLYRSQTVDFYESRPEKRSTRFWNIVVNSFLIYAIPSLLGVICSFVLTLLNGCAFGWLFGEMLITWCYQTILFLAVYAMSTLAALLTGTVVTAFLMNCYFFGIEALLRLTIYFHRSAYYATYDDAGEDLVVSRFYSLPPYHYLAGLIRSGAFYVQDSGYDWQTAREAIQAAFPGALCNLGIFAAAIAGAYLVHRLRKAEFAGKAVTYRGLATFIKSTATILFSLCAGLFIFWIFDTRRGAELTGVILTIIVTVFVGCMILEAIFGMNIRCALKRLWQAPILAAAALIILFIYRTDAFGYDRWVPAAEDVQTAFLVNPMYRGEYMDENGGYHDVRDYVKDNMFLKDIEDMRVLAEISQAQAVKQQNRSGADVSDADPEIWNSWYATIGWRMKNGRTITRCVQIPYTIDPALMDRIVGSEEFAVGVYRLEGVDRLVDSWRARYPAAAFELVCESEHGRRAADSKLLEEFLAVYRQDVTEHYSFSTASKQSPVGQVSLGTRNFYGPYTELSWPLYEGYDRSLAFLAEHELWKGGFLEPEEVDSVNLTYTCWGADGNDYREKREIVTDPAQIRELLDASLSTTYQSAWFRTDIFASFGDDEYGEYLDIEIYPVRDLQWELLNLASGYDEEESFIMEDRELKDGELTCYDRQILSDKVPAFVRDFVDRSHAELVGE
ncbi:MAG: hypothetical protein II800_08010 [Lachnospiraceae bacterium]|nr:hypothetical protein [Lachnospiraceae bacterium]